VSAEGPRQTLERRDCIVIDRPVAKTGTFDFNQFQLMPINETESTIAPDFCQLAPQYARDVGACLALRQYKMQDMTELSVTQFRAGSVLTR